MQKRQAPIPDTKFLSECFSLDADSGILTWRSRPLSHFRDERIMKIENTKRVGIRAGIDVYENGVPSKRVVGIRGETYSEHLIVWSMTNGIVPNGCEVDHINCDPHNNAPSNLRLVTSSQNKKNTRTRKNNKCGVTGVSSEIRRGKQKWRAVIAFDGRVKELPRSFTKGEAAVRRAKAVLQYHGRHGRVGTKSMEPYFAAWDVAKASLGTVGTGRALGLSIYWGARCVHEPAGGICTPFFVASVNV